MPAVYEGLYSPSLSKLPTQYLLTRSSKASNAWVGSLACGQTLLSHRVGAVDIGLDGPLERVLGKGDKQFDCCTAS